MTTNGPVRDGMIGAVGAAAGFVIGYLVQSIIRPKRKLSSSDSNDPYLEGGNATSPSFNCNEPHKLVLCVRTDLKMQKGKVAAQVGHATLGAYKRAQNRAAAALRCWEGQAQPKIALQISSKSQAERLERAARSVGLNTYMVYDAGRTQIAAGSMTVLAIGPGPARVIDQVTGSLRLL